MSSRKRWFERAPAIPWEVPALWSFDDQPRTGDPLLAGATPAAIRESLLPEDRTKFDIAYQRALATAREELDLTDLFRCLENWRRLALLQRDPERFASLARRAVERLTGEPVPDDEPLAGTRRRAGMQPPVYQATTDERSQPRSRPPGCPLIRAERHTHSNNPGDVARQGRRPGIAPGSSYLSIEVHAERVGFTTHGGTRVRFRLHETEGSTGPRDDHDEALGGPGQTAPYKMNDVADVPIGSGGDAATVPGEGTGSARRRDVRRDRHRLSACIA